MDPELLDALPDGVLAAGADGRVTVLNAVAAGLLGTDPAEAVGRHVRDVVCLRDRDGRGWFDCAAPYAGPGIRRGVPEQAWLSEAGEEVLVTARIHRAGRGGPVRLLTLGLRSGRARARLDRDRSDLVATVAHELRSPLTGVKGFVHALLNRWDRLSDDQRKLMLTTVSVDADRLGRLIAELLDVARIDTGRLSLHPRPADAEELARRVVESVAVGTSRPVALEVAGALPRVHADPDKFVQVLTNLVENGVRHGGGGVRVRLEPSGQPAGQPLEGPGVRVVVDDDGEGIPAEARRRVFTKFWTHGSGGGSGLGLYIVHGLVRAHGGDVRIEDAPGGGGRVVVEWPGADGR